MTSYKVAVVGATGLVGRTMLKVLEERNFPISKIGAFASARSAGGFVEFKGEKIEVLETREDSFAEFDIALFSAGGSASKKFAPFAAKAGCIVIDNSSAWRMDERCPLVVPEANPDALSGHHGIIANPNCSTIQMVAALRPIKDLAGLERVVVSTYQSISGAGQKGVDKLNGEINGTPNSDNHPIFSNAMFHAAEGDDGFTNEEIKMINETRKILSDNSLKVSATCVRLPFYAGHGESVNFQTVKEVSVQQIKEALAAHPGIIVMDDIKNEVYPTPRICQGTDPVYVGRIRKDSAFENGFYMWVVADNVRKGAATNAVQIAELLVKNDLMKFEAIID